MGIDSNSFMHGFEGEVRRSNVDIDSNAMAVELMPQMNEQAPQGAIAYLNACTMIQRLQQLPTRFKRFKLLLNQHRFYLVVTIHTYQKS